jgi:hypothetical protein
MIRTHHLSVLALALIFTAGIAVAQEPSLAEQAAAARAHSATTPPVSTVMGHISAGDYYNEILGFQIRHFRGWTSMSRGTMNVDEALGREALGLQAGINQSANRAFGMHDEEGNNVMVGIVPMPAATSPDPAAMKSAMAKILKAQIPSADVADEAILLGDSAHRFVGLRATYTVANREIFQSLQIIFLNGYGVSIATTSSSAEQLQSLLNQVRGSLQWISPSAQ